MMWGTLQAATGGTEHSFKRLRQTGEIVFFPKALTYYILYSRVMLKHA